MAVLPKIDMAVTLDQILVKAADKFVWAAYLMPVVLAHGSSSSSSSSAATAAETHGLCARIGTALKKLDAEQFVGGSPTGRVGDKEVHATSILKGYDLRAATSEDSGVERAIASQLALWPGKHQHIVRAKRKGTPKSAVVGGKAEMLPMKSEVVSGKAEMPPRQYFCEIGSAAGHVEVYGPAVGFALNPRSSFSIGPGDKVVFRRPSGEGVSYMHVVVLDPEAGEPVVYDAARVQQMHQTKSEWKGPQSMSAAIIEGAEGVNQGWGFREEEEEDEEGEEGEDAEEEKRMRKKMRTSNVTKYAVGQRVVNMGAQRVSGRIVRVVADGGGAFGPGCLTIEPQ